MITIAKNFISRDGYRCVLLKHEKGETIYLRKVVPHYIVESFPEVISVNEGDGWTEVFFPWMGGTQVKIGNGWKEFFVVHRIYGAGVRDCVRLGVEAWKHRGKAAGNAFIFRLPAGVEDGVEVQGVHLFEAEWVMRDVVAVG